MRRNKILILSILFALFSCSEDDLTPPSISSEYYFSGNVNDELVVINAEENNYQINSGWTSNWDEPPIGKYDLGFDTYPFEVGDLFITIITPSIEVGNKEKVLSLFPIGKLSDTEKEGFKLEYGKIVDKEEIETDIFHPVREELIGNFSELEIVSVIEKSVNTYKVKIKFSCTLYDEKENIQGEINNAEIILRLIIQK